MLSNFLISLLIPSRGRPGRLEDFLDSVYATTKKPNNIEIIIVLDDDDESKYVKRNIEGLHCKFLVTKKGKSMGELNRLCLISAKGTTVFFSNDDVIFKTFGWDELLLNKIHSLKKNNFLIYPNDHYKRKKLSTFPIMNRKFVLTYLELLPTIYKGSFMDLHIMDVFKAYDKGSHIYYMDNIVCEHRHYRLYPEFLDKTYKRRDRFGDDETFIRCARQRLKLVSKMEGVSLKEHRNLRQDSILYLLIGRASFSWKLKLFFYMIFRKIYKVLIHYINTFF